MILFSELDIRSVRAGVLGVPVSCLNLSAAGQAVPLFAQVISNENPVVTVRSSLTVGSLFRHGTMVIDSRSARAARYEVRGTKGRRVRLSVFPIDLQAELGNDRMEIRILPSDCAVSTDRGASWRAFSSGGLYEDLVFPDTDDPESAILVRIGASVTCGATQHRGDYRGGIMLVAEYLPDQQELFDPLYR